MASPSVDYDAPFQRAIELIGKRWSGAVIRALRHQPVRFNHLLIGIPGISDRVLTERLRELEIEGLVERLVDPGPPVRVSYQLSARGCDLEEVIGALDTWAGRWLGGCQTKAG
jgi:DNA-binding HxlR family transcriptional regulator